MNKEISKEEAIEILKKAKMFSLSETNQALTMAIEALEQKPPVISDEEIEVTDAEIQRFADKFYSPSDRNKQNFIDSCKQMRKAIKNINQLK